MTPEKLPLKLEGLDMDSVYENLVRQIAGETLETMLRFTLSPEFAAAERYSPLSPWYAPWQPNGSASGRVVSALLDFYGERRA